MLNPYQNATTCLIQKTEPLLPSDVSGVSIVTSCYEGIHLVLTCDSYTQSSVN